MSRPKMLLAIGAMLVVAIVVGRATAGPHDPTGTPFTFITDNMQSDPNPAVFDPFDPLTYDTATPILFGGSTYVPAAGVTVTTSSVISPTVPGLLLGSLDFVEIVVDTFTPDDISGLSGDGLYLSSTLPAAPPTGDSAFVIPDLGVSGGVSAFLTFIQFDDDGVFKTLTPALGVPIVPHPINGFDAIAIPTGGDDASIVPIIFSAAGLGGTMAALLSAFGVPAFEIFDVNSVHVSFEVVPEPASIALMGVALCSTLLMRRRK